MGVASRAVDHAPFRLRYGVGYPIHDPGILAARNVLLDSNKNKIKKGLVNFDPKMCKVGWSAQPVSAGWGSNIEF